MKKTSHRSFEPNGEKATSKKYIKRVYETKEAEEAIKEFPGNKEYDPPWEDLFKDTE